MTLPRGQRWSHLRSKSWRGRWLRTSDDVIKSVPDFSGGFPRDAWQRVENVQSHTGRERTPVRATPLSSIDYSRFAVLYVDDEQKSLKAFERQYGKTFWVLTATNAADGLRALKHHKGKIGVVLSNLRMPRRDGRWLLDRSRRIDPSVVRVLVSTFPTGEELAGAAAAANSGDIYTYVVLPWDPSLMERVLKRAMEHYALRRELARITAASPDETDSA